MRTRITGGITSLFLILTVSSMLITPVASATMINDSVIVYFGDAKDVAISNAINVLQENNKISAVIEYGSAKYLWMTSFSIAKDYILVGHGNDKGIQTSTGMISWEEYGNIANSLKVINYIHFINCDSSKVDGYLVRNGHHLSFSGPVDSTSAALISSLYMQSFRGLQNSFDKTMSKLQVNIDLLRSGKIGQNMFLMLDQGGGGGGGSSGSGSSSNAVFGTSELVFTAADLISFIISLIIGWKFPADKFEGIARVAAVGAKYAIMGFRQAINAANLVTATINMLYVLSVFWDNNLAGYLWNIFSFGDVLLICSIIVVWIAISGVTSGVAPAIALAAKWYWAASFVWWLTIDMNDADDYWHYTA